MGKPQLPCLGLQELQFLFPEIATRLPLCAYRSCLHDGESECAVKRALELGEIAETTVRRAEIAISL